MRIGPPFGAKKYKECHGANAAGFTCGGRTVRYPAGRTLTLPLIGGWSVQ